MPPKLRWSQSKKQYRDPSSCRFISNDEALRDARASAAIDEDILDSLADQMLNGELSVQQWGQAFRENLKRISIRQYSLGRGGVAQLDSEDYGSIGQNLKEQYGLFKGFYADVLEGNLTPAQIKARSRQYANATRVLYEAGKGAAHEIVLPALPGDGSTSCHEGDKCSWRIEVRKTRDTLAYWELDNAEHCPECLQRSRKWYPLLYRDGELLDGDVDDPRLYA